MDQTKKKTKQILSITFLILALGLIVVVQAGQRHQVINFPDEQRIRPAFMGFPPISASKESILILARGQTEDQKDLELFCQPFKVRVLFDGEEVKMLRFAWNDKDGEFVMPYYPGGVPIKWKFFYHIFEPGYFEPDWHTLSIEWYWYEGYGFYYNGYEVVHRHLESRFFYNLPFEVVA